MSLIKIGNRSLDEIVLQLEFQMAVNTALINILSESINDPRLSENAMISLKERAVASINKKYGQNLMSFVPPTPPVQATNVGGASAAPTPVKAVGPGASAPTQLSTKKPKKAKPTATTGK